MSAGLYFYYKQRRGLFLPLFILKASKNFSARQTTCARLLTGDMMNGLMWWMGLDCQCQSTDAFNARFQPKTNISWGTWMWRVLSQTVSRKILLFLCLSLPSSVMLFAGCSALATSQAKQFEDGFYFIRCFSGSSYRKGIYNHSSWEMEYLLALAMRYNYKGRNTISSIWSLTFLKYLTNVKG